jgi:hypothetical protein
MHVKTMAVKLLSLLAGGKADSEEDDLDDLFAMYAGAQVTLQWSVSHSYFILCYLVYVDLKVLTLRYLGRSSLSNLGSSCFQLFFFFHNVTSVWIIKLN